LFKNTLFYIITAPLSPVWLEHVISLMKPLLSKYEMCCDWLAVPVCCYWHHVFGKCHAPYLIVSFICSGVNIKHANFKPDSDLSMVNSYFFLRVVNSITKVRAYKRYSKHYINTDVG